MLDKNNTVKITNRNNGRVGYTIPDLGNLYRSFESGETKEVTMEELRKLSYIPGGQSLIDNYFIIENTEAVEELVSNVEPEYNYTEEDVRNLLLNGSLDELLDCLDFAPKGVIELVKKISVNEKLNDIQKRKAIQEKTGFNITSAIAINEETSEERVEEVKERRASKPAAKENTGRRTEPTVKSKYKVVTK